LALGTLYNNNFGLDPGALFEAWADSKMPRNFVGQTAIQDNHAGFTASYLQAFVLPDDDELIIGHVKGC
jgi:hypothetical protein